MPATVQQLAELQRVNDAVNAVPYVADSPVFGELPDYHAVLWAEAGGESWVLDNRFPKIYRWDQDPPNGPYKWALRQVAGTDGFLDISAA